MGFWAAFWMYGDGNTNPFLDGFEVDGFEDFHTRRRRPDGKPGLMNEHNFHIRTGLGTTRSWHSNSLLPDDFEGWHTLGMKWTPSEVAYYLDGKLLRTCKDAWHISHGRVAMDAFRHATGTSPEHAVLSCCIVHNEWNKAYGDIRGCKFPAYFEVDWVRIWEYPDEKGMSPEVNWTQATCEASQFVPTGAVSRLSVATKPSETGAKIVEAYLFDNGFHIATKADGGDFDFEMSEEFLKKTAYMRPGRDEKDIPKFDAWPHVFHVFVRDENGRIGRTKEPLIRVPRFSGALSAWGEKPIAIPGKLSPAHFDRGGLNVAYYRTQYTVSGVAPDLSPRPSKAFRGDEYAACSADGSALDFVITGEWSNYQVDVAESGRYRVTFPYGTPGHGINRVDWLVDGKLAAQCLLEYHDSDLFERDRIGTFEVQLKKGRHTLTLIPIGPISVGTFDFKQVK